MSLRLKGMVENYSEEWFQCKPKWNKAAMKHSSTLNVIPIIISNTLARFKIFPYKKHQVDRLMDIGYT